MEKFMDGTIQNFKDVCSVQSGSLKKIYDVKNVVTEKAKNTYKYLGSWFSKKKEDLKKELTGIQSPSFEGYENYKGGTSSLSDFKGKYVYVDVWATWCGPCKAEIPSLKKVEKAYQEKNIEFLSISLDALKDKEAWKTMIVEKEMGGVQLFATNSWE